MEGRDASTAHIYMERMAKVQQRLAAIGTFNIVPEFLPQQFIDVGWGTQDTDAVALLGNNTLDVGRCEEKPTIVFESSDKVFYTIAAIDIDDAERGAPYLLWLKQNVTGDIRFASGKDIVRWQPPLIRESDSGKPHQIFFFVFHQGNGEIGLNGAKIISKNSRERRARFSLAQLITSCGLKHIIGANMVKMAYSRAVSDRLERDLRDEVVLNEAGNKVLAEVNGGVRTDFQ
jgi:hypothetical protein